MNSVNKIFRNALLGAIACLLVVSISTPALSKLVTSVSTHLIGSNQSNQSQILPLKDLDNNLQSATSVLLAQGLPSSTFKTYIAALSPKNVVPSSPTTDARGTVGASLSGNRLVVRASFRQLSSALRDYATDPVNPPNPNITSAFHIHKGASNANGPFQYALNVTLNTSGDGGSAAGDYTLTPEQLQALDQGQLYVDLHTTKNRGGELRGILLTY
ncbi:CHRD domain-containing protein [Calothrix sp. PCC 7507]|uniref:CHRD domain-containing protein n=1 Tax=Calothrix sp. PCC 7507 TaxID=99598 RepID=UPI00029EEC18|nr:CHRD domain-containing protein [Calothrix sp. PCC 7507]AFY30615.1 CHRD domain containing protein [Calothrix sp. PCC 7507]